MNESGGRAEVAPADIAAPGDTKVIPTRAGARAAGGPHYLVVTRAPGLAMALGRLAELQHLSIMFFWSLDTLLVSPLLVADVMIIDQELWRDLHADLHSKVQALLASVPAVLITTQEHAAVAVAANDRVSAVLPTNAGASAILHAAIKTTKGEGELGDAR